MLSVSVSAVALKEPTYARAQFLALGAGVIVGRPASALTPSSLSLIGRRWVASPARCVVVELGQMTDSRARTRLAFSFSATLGLTSDPVAVDFGGGAGRKLCGWVGPLACGLRFARVVSSVLDGRDYSYIKEMRVCDLGVGANNNSSSNRRCTEGGNGVGGVVVATMRTSAPNMWARQEVWANSRTWTVATANTLRGGGAALSLWKLDGLGDGKAPEKVEHVPLPWRVRKMAFNGKDSLVIRQDPGQGNGVMIVDLQSTLEQGRAVGSEFTVGSDHCTRNLWCWRGNVYTTLVDESLLCITTGERTEMPWGSRPELVGGPYFATLNRTSEGTFREVRSVVEPNKVCSRHRVESMGSMAFGRELVVWEPGAHTFPNYIEVIDAVSGFVIFRMLNTVKFYVFRVL
ncbi:hypothetical protein Pelo_9325 [Pelomyxa schiedti]|nr:hypothetical protein Pelo_9325 [Pelomyxa schiedti]